MAAPGVSDVNSLRATIVLLIVFNAGYIARTYLTVENVAK